MSREIAQGRTVAIFGEDYNDRVAVQELVLGLRTDVGRRDTLLLRRPLTLVKNMDEAKRKARSDKVLDALRAAHVRTPLRAVVFHEDTDAVEPAHIALAEDIKRMYSAAPCPVLTAVPAWEMETWWLQFPNAVGALHDQWRDPDQYVGRNVGLLPHAKEKLRECVRPSGVRRGPRFREYEVSDSSAIAKNIVDMNLVHKHKANSASWLMVVQEVQSLPPVPSHQEQHGKARSGRTPRRRRL